MASTTGSAGSAPAYGWGTLAGDVNLIAEMAGCSRADRDQHYLANLERLGLVRLSAEPVTDRRRYAFVEAQPKATEPMERVGKAKTIYRSIYLSVFGQQFSEICFDLEGYDAGGWANDDRGDKILGKGPRRPKKHGH
ncbi:MAG TPA: Abi-alpha family protein [Pseudonocardia sp.]|nr:Abi-alpha family protein [Pseudonocardia sp.]